MDRTTDRAPTSPVAESVLRARSPAGSRDHASLRKHTTRPLGASTVSVVRPLRDHVRRARSVV